MVFHSELFIHQDYYLKPCTGYLSIRAAYVTLPAACLPAWHYVDAQRQPSIECYIHVYWMTTLLLQNFHRWDTEYRAQTHQATEITWLIRLFINMTRRGQIQQAPPYPPGLVREIGREGEKAPGMTKKYIRLRGVYCGCMLHPHILLHVTYSIKTYFKGKFTIALRTWQ